MAPQMVFQVFHSKFLSSILANKNPLDANATDSEAYHSDAKGRRVTPRISEPPPSATPFSIGKQKKKTAEQLAREAQDEYRKKKREIGPGVDRGGSRLVTAKRRKGFVDDEDGDEVMVDRSD